MSTSPSSAPADRRDGPPFETDAELDAWLRRHGLTHVARLGMAVLAPFVEAAYLPQLRSAAIKRRLVELVTTEGLARSTFGPVVAPRMRELLPQLACRFLEEERVRAEEERANVQERLVPPEDPRTHPAHQLLLDARAKLPGSVAPLPLRSLRTDPLTYDADVPGFRWRESRYTELGTGPREGMFILPEVVLTFSPTEVRVACTCGADACVHQLATIDRVLLWLKQPPTKSFIEAVEELVRPGWERTLLALEQAVEGAPSEVAELTWRLDVLGGYGVSVTPYGRKKNKKGQLSAGARLSRRKLLLDFGPRLSPTDARLAALLPESGPASAPLLFALVDHPEVYLDSSPEERVRIEKARVGLVAEDRGGIVSVTIGIDGVPLPAAEIDRIRRSTPDEALFLWEEGERRLTVLEVSAEIRAAIQALKRHQNAFPRESHGALVEKLAQLARRVPVAMPRSVMGESIPSEQRAVIRLEAQPGGAVRMELRVRPLPESAPLVPGEGPRDVHVRRGTDAFHAVRDLAKEEQAAEALRAKLPMHTAEVVEDEPFTYRFPSAQGALAVLEASAALDPRPALEWRGNPMRLAPARGPPALRVQLERKRDWFGLLGELSVEGERVELARLVDAARRKQRYVQVTADTYVAIEEALRAHLERLADHTHTSRHGLEVGPSAVETLTALENAGVAVEADAVWRGLAERIFAAKELNPRPPSKLKGTLRDYQREGFTWLTRLASWGAGAVLADDMGLGKTIQALAVLLDRSKQGPSLVLAPTSVAFNWVDEAKRFAPSLKIQVFAEADDRGLVLERLGPGDVLVLSYGLLTRDIERLAAVRFGTIIFDEAQTLKNAVTQRFRAARALQGDFKVALSGTPLENHLGELWALFAVVFPGLLGSWEAFRTRFAMPIERQLDPTAAPALARVLQPFLLRRTKAQVESELPPRTDVRVQVALSQEEWTLYEDARLAALSELNTPTPKLKEQERRIQVLAALTRLRLLASHPRLYDPQTKVESSKLQRFLELVDELRAEGHRALVFSQFTSHLALVREVLDAQGITYEYLDGSTPPSERADRVRAFQEGEATVFLISLKAGGFGLNLTAATSVIHLDPWWNPAVEDQASDRAHRIGQTRPVTVYRLVARGTIEEQMLGLHEHKRALVSEVLEGKDQAGKLSTRDLLNLLAGKLEREETVPLTATKH